MRYDAKTYFGCGHITDSHFFLTMICSQEILPIIFLLIFISAGATNAASAPFEAGEYHVVSSYGSDTCGANGQDSVATVSGNTLGLQQTCKPVVNHRMFIFRLHCIESLRHIQLFCEWCNSIKQ